MIWKKPSIQDRILGTLSYSHKQWVSNLTSTPAGDLLVSVEGDSATPNPIGLNSAREIVSHPTEVVAAAMAFAQGNPQVKDFMDGQGELALDGFSFKSAPGSFHVELSLSKWPDAMISVVFKDNLPCDVVLAD